MNYNILFREADITNLFENLLLEDITDFEEVVYIKHDTSQFVSISNHANDRNERKWWKSYTDSNFTNFVNMALSILHSMFKRKLEIDAKLKLKDNNPHLNGVEFKEHEQFGFCNKERTLGLATSLRKTEGKYCTSFSITTILNKNSSTMKKDKELFLYGFKQNHELILHNFNLITESIDGNKIHIIEMNI